MNIQKREKKISFFWQFLKSASSQLSNMPDSSVNYSHCAASYVLSNYLTKFVKLEVCNFDHLRPILHNPTYDNHKFDLFLYVLFCFRFQRYVRS